MSNSGASAGVCAACKHDPECIFETAASTIILQCEQFEMTFRGPAVPPKPVPFRAASIAAKATNGFAGLCSNCQNRDSCIYPKPEGGVWRCEEYE